MYWSLMHSMVLSALLQNRQLKGMCSEMFNQSAGFSMKQKTQHEDCQDISVWKKLWCDMSECLFSLFVNVVDVLHQDINCLLWTQDQVHQLQKTDFQSTGEHILVCYSGLWWWSQPQAHTMVLLREKSDFWYIMPKIPNFRISPNFMDQKQTWFWWSAWKLGQIKPKMTFAWETKLCFVIIAVILYNFHWH